MESKMSINNWFYYNHAAIPSTPPHVTPSTECIDSGEIWHIEGNTPLLARWTTDFDCGYETNWWYVIKEAPFDMAALSAKEQKSIRQALRKTEAKIIKMTEHTEELYECYKEAFARYDSATIPMTIEEFSDYCKTTDEKHECWGTFELETHHLTGYMTVYVLDGVAETLNAKFDCRYLKTQASDALYYYILTHYLNERGLKYVSGGERSISHVTGTQDYKIKRFGYKKAYCKLNLVYNPKIKPFVKIAYAFRGLFKLLDKIRIFHLVNGVIAMERIVREGKKMGAAPLDAIEETTETKETQNV